MITEAPALYKFTSGEQYIHDFHKDSQLLKEVISAKWDNTLPGVQFFEKYWIAVAYKPLEPPEPSESFESFELTTAVIKTLLKAFKQSDEHRDGFISKKELKKMMKKAKIDISD